VKNINAIVGDNVEVIFVTAGVIYSNHYALKISKIITTQ
jgi:hypothetical protein